MKRLRQIMTAYNDDAVIALANKGLFRRATKDLQKGIAVAIAAQDDHNIILNIVDAKVTMPEAGPASATCTCPATGVCRHIVTAVLFLKEYFTSDSEKPKRTSSKSPHSGTSKPLKDELLAINSRHLQKWGGIKNLRKAIELVAEETFIDSDDADRLIVTFTHSGVKVHFIKGAGLDGALISGASKDKRAFISAAVLIYQKSQGQPIGELKNKPSFSGKRLNITAVNKAAALLKR